jgi:hypothetical protein
MQLLPAGVMVVFNAARHMPHKSLALEMVTGGRRAKQACGPKRIHFTVCLFHTLELRQLRRLP